MRTVSLRNREKEIVFSKILLHIHRNSYMKFTTKNSNPPAHFQAHNILQHPKKIVSFLCVAVVHLNSGRLRCCRHIVKCLLYFPYTMFGEHLVAQSQQSPASHQSRANQNKPKICCCRRDDKKESFKEN